MSLGFSIIETAGFRKQLKKLNKKAISQLKIRLVVFSVNEFDPILSNHKLHGEYAECRSINITNDLRLVYKRVDEGCFLLIAVGTHSQLYE